MRRSKILSSSRVVPRRLIRPFEACRAKTHFQGSSACGLAGYTFSLDDALKALAALDERKSKVVELKFFGGLSMEEIAEVLRVSTDTVKRDWKVARLWLLRELAWRTEWNRDLEPGLWQRVEGCARNPMVQRVLELDESRRAEFLESFRRGDEALRRQVESLLAQEKRVNHFVDSPALEAASKSPAM